MDRKLLSGRPTATTTRQNSVQTTVMNRPPSLRVLLLLFCFMRKLLSGRPTATTIRQISVQTAGCIPSDDIASFFSYPQYRMRIPKRPQKGWKSWDTMWLCNMLPETLRSSGILSTGEMHFDLAQGQTVNTFLGARTETNNKAKLCEHVRKAFPQSSGRHYHAHCFNLPEHTEQLRKVILTEPNARWVFKPSIGSGGRGIRLLSGQDIIDNNLLDLPVGRTGYIQRYIVDTLLLDFQPQQHDKMIKVKFDWRAYFAITSLHPLRVLVHRKGFARMTTKEFSVKSLDDARDAVRHIANMDFQKKFKDYRWSRSRHDDCTASSRSLQCVLGDIARQTNRKADEIWRGVLESLGKVAASLRSPLKKSSELNCEGCYQLWGADLVFNSSGNAFVLEVNTSPAIDRDDLLASGSVMHDVYYDLRMAKGIDPTARIASCDVIQMFRAGYLNRAWRNSHKLGLVRELMMRKEHTSIGSTTTKHLNSMISEFVNRGDFDLAWPKKSEVFSRLDRNAGETGPEQKGDDGIHLMTFEEARLYELFFAISSSPSALQSCF